ncbi:MAG: Fpg/Nei family DNA glycosylase, partial [Pseudomonadota bacterium]
ATSLHQTVERVELDAEYMLEGASGQTVREALRGHRFAGTNRHGKYLFVALDEGPWLVLHFGMTGYLRYDKGQDPPPDHTRMLIGFDNGHRLCGVWRRRLGRIDLADDVADFVEAQDLGPDAFALGLEPFEAMLNDRRGGLKSALMDQSFIAGLGNVYGDEVLFRAGLLPDRKAKDLDHDEIADLHRALRHVLRTAIDRQADPEEMPSTWLLGHRREGAHCPRCGHALRHDKVAGRTAWYCPHCQH